MCGGENWISPSYGTSPSDVAGKLASYIPVAGLPMVSSQRNYAFLSSISARNTYLNPIGTNNSYAKRDIGQEDYSAQINQRGFNQTQQLNDLEYEVNPIGKKANSSTSLQEISSSRLTSTGRELMDIVEKEIGILEGGLVLN